MQGLCTAPTSVSRDDNDDRTSGRFGRLILDDDDASRSRYVSSGFWAKINDELDELRAETESLGASSEEEEHAVPVPLAETARTPAERNAFVFGHNVRPPLGALADYRPLPSQVPYLCGVYEANVNTLVRIVHVPTLNAMVDGLLAGEAQTPAAEALLFAVYYAATASSEEAEVVRSFGVAKADLLLRYRRGLELALAEADFLCRPDLLLVQALLVFLLPGRRYAGPRFVWMMTGVVIRMGQSLGLQRDGSCVGPSLTPLDVEMRRRLWWALCALDVRSSEDQGTDLTILPGTYDTRLPLNINDVDVGPDSRETPRARNALTDMTYTLLNLEITQLAQRMMALAGAAGPSAAEQGRLRAAQGRLVDEIYCRLDAVYLRHVPDTDDIVHWAAVTMTRIVMAKMSLIVYLPTLLGEKQPRGDEHLDEALRARLLSSAVEVAERNHSLHAEPGCRRWRWLCDTYTQWHAIAFLLMETARRPWDPAVERAWAALHSPHLLPRAWNRDDSSTAAATTHFWLPLRRLWARSRRHRTAELARLRADSQAARQLEAVYDADVAQGRSCPLSNPDATSVFRSRWRRLVQLEAATPTRAPGDHMIAAGQDSSGHLQDPPLPASGTSPYDPWLWTGPESSGANEWEMNGAEGEGEVEGMDEMNGVDGVDEMNWGNWLASLQEWEREQYPGS